MIDPSFRIIRSSITPNYSYIESNFYNDPRHDLYLAKFLYERKDNLLSISIIYHNYKGDFLYTYTNSLENLLALGENRSCNIDINFIDMWFNNATVGKIDSLTMSSKLRYTGTSALNEPHFAYIRILFVIHKITPQRLAMIKSNLEEEYYYEKYQKNLEEKRNQCIIL